MIARVCSHAALAVCVITFSPSASATPLETFTTTTGVTLNVFAVPDSATASGPDIFAAGLGVGDLTSALTGTPLLDDGIVNLATGEFVTLTFAEPVFNTPGADLAVFQLDGSGAFDPVSISTDADPSDLTTANVLNLSESDALTLSNGSGGPLTTTLSLVPNLGAQTSFGGTVVATPVDLSDLGIADGQSVTFIQLISPNVPGSDPDILGVGVIPEPTTLALSALTLAGVAVRRRR